MNDIVERLRMGLATPIEMEAANEIERLTAAHDHQYAVAGTLLREAERANREIERLRDENEHMGVALVNSDPFKTVWEQEQEISRLREELANCLHLDNHNAIVRNRNDEIERLRAHIAEIEAWRQQGEDLLAPASSWGEYLPSSTLFKLGNWWALRPWGKR